MSTYTPSWPVYGQNTLGTHQGVHPIDPLSTNVYYSLGTASAISSNSGKCVILNSEDTNDIVYVFSLGTIYAYKTPLTATPPNALWQKTISTDNAATQIIVNMSLNNTGTELWITGHNGGITAYAGITVLNAITGADIAVIKTDPLILATYVIFPLQCLTVYFDQNNNPYLIATAFKENSNIRYFLKLNSTTYAVERKYQINAPGTGYQNYFSQICFDPNSSSIYVLVNARQGFSGNNYTYLYRFEPSVDPTLFDVISSTSYDYSGTPANKGYGIIFRETENQIVVSFAQGLRSFNTSWANIDTYVPGSTFVAPASMNQDNFYLRSSTTLYKISYSSGLFSEDASTAILPSGATHYAAPIIDSDGNIIVGSNIGTVGVSNVHIFSSTDLTLLNSFRLSSGGAIANTPSVGNRNLLYIIGNAVAGSSRIYVYGPAIAPTTTTTTTPTTTTTTTTPTTTTTTTGTGTTTTTTTPTTTTTTTTPAPLSIVSTTQFVDLVAFQSSNASDSLTTQNSLLAQSFSFGTIAPGQTSKTIIVALNIPYAKAITNIKIGLTSTGGITFSNNIFGITNSIELREDITPDNYFQGINTDNTSANAYNISIPNKDSHTSDYVYLNVQVPSNQVIEEGIIKLRWFFDYAE